MYTFVIDMDPALARRAWNSRFRRVKISYWLLALVLMALTVWADLHDGSLQTASVITLSIFGLWIAVIIIGYVLGLRALLRGVREGGPCVYTLTDTTLNLADSCASVALNWPTLAEIRNLDDFVSVRVKGGGTVFLPTSQIPPEALACLVERSRSHGAKVIGF